MTHNIEWESEHPEFTENQRKKIAQELAHLTEELDQPSDLIFHHIWFSEDTDGPAIMVYGKPDHNDTFFMSYYEETKWVTLDEDDALEN